MILKKFPHPIILVLLLIFVAAGLTYVLPSGSYDRELNEISGREVVVPGTYHETDSSPISFFDIWVSIPRALSETSEVIFLVFLIGGAFVVVEKTSALNQGVYFLTNKIKGNSNLIIVFVSILFTLAGAMNNTQEEIVAVIPVLVILTGSFGLKPQVAVAMSTGSAIIGAAFSPINPFQVGIAQKLAQVELFSGALYRGIFLLIGMSLWIVILIRYANKTKRIIPEGNNEIQEKLSKKSLLIFLLVATTFGVMVIGILNWDWDF
ncbi:MAG: YfcC family protein, partial [Cyclobacteriaceae bacterium]|nr:YfcC family protein [Cyclobacteriaceae bacterium]